MKRFLAIAAILFLCAACASFPANAQNTPSNAVWVGVSVNVTNGTVSPPILEQRIATGGSGIDTNDIVMKWPSWYQFGTMGIGTNDANRIEGVFYDPTTISGLGLVLQGLNRPVRIRSIATQSGFTAKDVILEALHGAVRFYSFNHVINSTNRPTWNGAGIATTNDFDTVFTNGTARSVAITPLDYDEWEESSLASKAGVFAATGSVSVLVMRAPGGNVVNIHDGGEIDLGEDGSFVFVPGSLEATNDVKAESFTLGTNTITEWPTGGGGLSGARVVTTNYSVSADDYLIWLDTREFSASDSVTLTLPDMDGDSQTIVVRRLGNTGEATIARGTNTWTLGYDGDGVTVDWLGAATNWFWRSF